MYHQLRTLGIVAVTLVLSANLLAADHEQAGFTLNPHVGFYNFDSDRNLEDTVFPGLGLGYQFNNPWGLEFNYLANDTDVDSGANTSVDFEQLRIDALYHLRARENWQPYLAFGVGENNFDASIGNIDETVINLGGGIKYALTNALSLRTDLRLFNSMDEEDQDFALSLGLHYLFGANTRRPPAASTPNTPVNTPVDSDGDGVVDASDRCPSTPANTVVDANGCELDSDRDGVADARDACPNSESGARVDERGCYIILQETRTIELNINFANDSAEISAQYMDQIQKVADFMREYPLTQVVVEGHTDDRGQASYNQQLSERRARAVAAELVNRFSIAAERVAAVGKGEVEPLATNDTAEGRATNRRVVGVISATTETRAQ